MIDTIQLIVEHFFYVLGLAFLCYEAYVLYFLTTYKVGYQEKINYTNTKVCVTSYFLWICAGLYSSQWLLFVILLGLCFIDSHKNRKWWIVDSVFSILVIAAILINKYFYRYDLVSLKAFVEIIHFKF